MPPAAANRAEDANCPTATVNTAMPSLNAIRPLSRLPPPLCTSTLRPQPRRSVRFSIRRLSRRRIRPFAMLKTVLLRVRVSRTTDGKQQPGCVLASSPVSSHLQTSLPLYIATRYPPVLPQLPLLEPPPEPLPSAATPPSLQSSPSKLLDVPPELPPLRPEQPQRSPALAPPKGRTP
jgi:hypothetical protein